MESCCGWTRPIPRDPLRDRFILSKGHAASALYATLAARGFFPERWLDSFAKHGSPLAEQPSPGCAPGVELATGSLGHGLPVGCGMALAAQIQNRTYRVYVVMSDGECNEGSVWEAALFAPANKLGNVVVIIDYNKWQATGRSNEVMALPPCATNGRRSAGDACEVNGHDITSFQALARVPDDRRQADRRSSPTPSRARVFPSWKTTTTGTTASPRAGSRGGETGIATRLQRIMPKMIADSFVFRGFSSPCFTRSETPKGV